MHTYLLQNAQSKLQHFSQRMKPKLLLDAGDSFWKLNYTFNICNFRLRNTEIFRLDNMSKAMEVRNAQSLATYW